MCTGKISAACSLCYIARQANEKRLRGELEGPDAHLFEATFAGAVVVKDVAGEGVVHLIGTLETVHLKAWVRMS